VGGSDQAFDLFFNPRGVVLVGASRDPQKLGYGIARNLTANAYVGAVHFVNPNAAGPLLGRNVCRTLGDVPDPVDLAVLLVPAGMVPDTIAECGERGIKAVIIASGGFRETGAVGADLEERCGRVAAEYGIRLLGPNCVGTIDTHLGFNTTFLAPPGPEAGEVAFISHSGAMCAAVIDWSAGQGFGLSRLVSLGNQADVDETAALEMVAADHRTQVVTMYLETVSDGRRFVELASQMEKPVVVVKVGRFEGGRRAVVSHTGALAGREEAYRAAFRRAGVIRVPTTEAMLDAARALAWAALPSGRRIAVLTNAGGPGVTTADAVEAEGLWLAELSTATRWELAGSLPDGAGLTNPVDMLASAAPEDFARSLQILLAAPEVDGVVVVCPPPPMFSADQVAEALVPVVGSSPKPVLVSLMGDQAVRVASRRLRAARIPDYRFPERAAAAMAVLAGRAETLTSPNEPPPDPSDVDRGSASRLLAGVAPGWLGPLQGSQLVATYGIAVPAASTAHTAAEAVEAAASLGGPVVLKVDAPEAVHKSDLGGVRLGLSSQDEIRAAFDSLTALAESLALGPIKEIGVHIQRMVERGQDVIVGGVRDAQFGPLIMFGSGGIEVEGLSDVEFALAPLTKPDLAQLFSRTWAGRRLPGYRSVPAGDGAAVEEALVRLGWLLCNHPRIREIEINPLRALSPGLGAVALDVRVRVE
jgi:acetyltransferase